MNYNFEDLLDQVLSDLAALEDEQAETAVAHPHADHTAPAPARQKRKTEAVERPAAPARNAREISDLTQSRHMGADERALVTERSDHTPIPTIHTNTQPAIHTPITHAPITREIIAEAIRAWRQKNKSAVTANKAQATKRRNAERAAQAPWDRLDEIHRLPHYGAHILSTGRAVAITIDFARDVLARASKHKHGIFDHLRRRISAALPGVPCLLTHERGKNGHDHIHGLIEWSGSLPALYAALKPAAGRWDHARGSGHQIRLQSDQQTLIDEKIIDTDQQLTAGWLDYISKASKRLRKETGRKTIYASQELKRQCKEIHGNNNRSRNGATSDNRQSLLTDITDNTPEHLLTDESILTHKHTDATSGAASDSGYDYAHASEDADHHGRRLREPLCGHARYRPQFRPALRRNLRHTPGPRLYLVHDARPDLWRRRARPP